MCSVDGCEIPAEKRGWCGMHYRRWQRHGHLDNTRLPADERFWSKVDRLGPLPLHRPGLGPCWLWTAGCFADGYGMFYLDRRTRHAHTVAYGWEVGQVPDGLELDHLCRVRHCVRPSHLEPVTTQVNLARGYGAPARNARKSECAYGHPFTVENTIRFGPDNRWRKCRECVRSAAREYQRARRARLASAAAQHREG